MGMGGNIGNLMKQAQKMQQDMAKAQEELKEKTVEATGRRCCYCCGNRS